MNDSGDQPRKIIIDEDWKSQVESEKDALRQQEQTTTSEGADAHAESDEEMPPASFAAHIMTLATQATAGLGQMPNPDKPDEPPPVNLEFAKYVIDTIAVLDEKTRGNLTTEEAAMMENLLHQLRVLYVEVSRQVAS